MLRPILLFLSLSFFGHIVFSQNECFPFQIGNGFCLSKDGRTAYISKPTGKSDNSGKPIYGIYQSIFNEENTWSEPEPVSFGDARYTEYRPILNDENDKLFFISRRPEPETKEPVAYGNLWYVQRTNNGWSQPIFLASVNQKGHDTYPSLTSDGTLYFNSDRSGGKSSMDIYKSEFIDGEYQTPVPVSALNSKESENDLVIAPNGHFIIFNRYIFDSGELDLFISFYENDEWTEPQPLDIINEKGVFELTPGLSSDLKTFYYEVNGKVRCIELDKLLRSVR